MIRKQFVIDNKTGLQVAEAGNLVNKIRNHRCKIVLEHNDMNYDAKSLLCLMCAGVRYGQEVTFIFDGEDETDAFNTVAGILRHVDN